ncbi:MAG: hypothetical protein LBD44_02840 [Spirochaetaceae bacterium]|nr:hypothetical protein [Spirochaetaceae bacterium]
MPDDSSDFAGGQGTPESPWKIETARQLEEVRNHLDGYYVLNADIDLSSYGNFSPIGIFEPVSDAPEDQETPKLELAFTGIFDGKGHKISNVAISVPTQAGVGLFGCVAGDNGAVKNLVVENVTATGYMLVSGVVGYKSSVNTFENITLQGTNSISGTQMIGGIVGGGFGDIKNCNAVAAITLTGEGDVGMAGILAGGMEDSSIISCTVIGGSINAVAGSIGIGGLAACAQLSAEVKNCAVSNVAITVGENCFIIGGLLGYAGTYAPDIPTAIDNCKATNVTISAPASTERIGGIIGSGFYTSAYAAMASMPGYEFLGAPGAFTVTNSASSGSITGGCTDLVGKIAGYIYDNSTVAGTCTSTMAGVTNNVGGDKNSAAL